MNQQVAGRLVLLVLGPVNAYSELEETVPSGSPFASRPMRQTGPWCPAGP